MIFVWIPYSISALVSALGFICRGLPCGEKRRVDMVITTIATSQVKDALFDTIEHTTRISNGTVYLLTEPWAAPEIIEHAKEKGLTIIIVPKDFADGKAKGRAISYFAKNIAFSDRWYMFLDDDSYPMDNKFQYQVGEAEKRGRLMGNCILVGRKGRNLLTHLADNLRHADDLGIFRFSLQGTGTPLIGMHGEGLLIYGDVLRKYWNGLSSIVEDAEFACKVNGKVKAFQSSTEVSILSPNSIIDFWKQRRRWYIGLWSIFNQFPPLGRLLLLIRLIAWSVGWLGALNWLLIPYTLVVGFGFGITPVGIFTGLGFFLLVSYYLIGARRTKTILSSILLFPAYTTIETWMPLYTLYTGFRKGTAFEVINKNK